MVEKIEIQDLSECPSNGRYYRGNAGVKYGISIDGEDWIVKYPKNTSEFAKAARSYTTSPLNEYLGSKVYETFGLPVHDTMLGVRDGKLVVACKDFVLQFAGAMRLVEFRDLKNSVNADKVLPDGSVSSGSSMHLSDILEVIDTHPVLVGVPGTKERFWDMFLVDALIRNTDRNNTNWGVLLPERGCNLEARLAPVYDNGNSFFTARSNEQNRAALESGGHESIFRDFRTRFLDDEGNPISAVKLLASHEHEGLDSAAIRFAERFDLDAIMAVFDSLPAEHDGIEVLPDDTKKFYREMVAYRAKSIFENAGLMAEKLSKARCGGCEQRNMQLANNKQILATHSTLTPKKSLS